MTTSASTHAPRRGFRSTRSTLAMLLAAIALSVASTAAPAGGIPSAAQDHDHGHDHGHDSGAAHDDHDPTPADVAAEVLRELESIGYRFDVEPPKVVTMSRSAARKEGVRSLEVGPSTKRLEGLLALQRGFGEWDVQSDEDLRRAFDRAVSESRNAFYDEQRRCVVALERARPTEVYLQLQRHFVARALVHAWHDQDGELLDRVDGDDPTTEQANLRHAIIEGEAGFVAAALTLMRDGAAIDGLLDADTEETMYEQLGVSAWKRAEVEGRRFASLRWKDGGFDGVRDAWVTRPTSTEQLLHRDKYGVDVPRAVTLPDWPEHLVDAELVADDVMGELETWRLLTTLSVDPDVARAAAAGWDGDRLRVYRTETGGTLVAWRTVWDRNVDAEQFYAALAKEGDGEWRLRGRVIDWARSSDGPLAGAWLDHAAAHDMDVSDDADARADGAGTRDVERAWGDDALLDPFDADGRIVAPRAGFSVPLPQGWSLPEYGDELQWAPEGDALEAEGFLQVVTVTAPGQESVDEMLEDLEELSEEAGATRASRDTRTIDGRDVVTLTTVLEQGGASIRSVTMLVAEGRRFTVLNVSGTEDFWEAHGADCDAIVDEVRFDADDYSRPDAEEVDPPPPPGRVLHLVVQDGFSGAPVPGAEVDVLTHFSFSLRDDVVHFDRLARERGRRFTTDEAGQVSVPYSSRYVRVVARRDGRLGVHEPKFYRMESDEVDVVRIMPFQRVEVLVVDADGAPVEDVPVGTVFEHHRGPWLGECVFTDRDGRVEFVHPLNDVVERSGDVHGAHLRLAFPHADVQRVRLTEDARFDDPVVLVLPETVELALGETGADEESRRYGLQLRARGAPEEPGFSYYRWNDPPQGDVPEGFEYYPHVGTGVELEAAHTIHEDWTPIGVLDADEPRAELVADFSYRAPRANTSVRVVIDQLDDGDALEFVPVDWRVSYMLREHDHGPRWTLGRGRVVLDSDGSARIGIDPDWFASDHGYFGRDAGLESVVRELRIDVRMVDAIHGERHWVGRVDVLWPGERDDVFPRGLTGPVTFRVQRWERVPAPRRVEARVVDRRGDPLDGQVLSLLLVDTDGATKVVDVVQSRFGGICEFDRPELTRGQSLRIRSREAEWASVTVDVPDEGAVVTLRMTEVSEGPWVEIPVMLPEAASDRSESTYELPRFFVGRADGGEGQTDMTVRTRWEDDGWMVRVFGLEPGEHRFYVALMSSGAGGRMYGPADDSMPSSARMFASARLGESGPTQLDLLDLREAGVELALELVDRDGAAVEALVHWGIVNERGATDTGSRMVRDGVLTLRILGDRANVRLSTNEGWSATARDLTSGAHRVVMSPPAQVRLEPSTALPDLASLEHGQPGDALAVVLHHVDPEGADHRVPRSDLTAFEDGAAEVRVQGTGTWSVQWFVVRRIDGLRRRRPVLDPDAGPRIDVRAVDGVQTIVVAPPSAEDCERALRGMGG